MFLINPLESQFQGKFRDYGCHNPGLRKIVIKM